MYFHLLYVGNVGRMEIWSGKIFYICNGGNYFAFSVIIYEFLPSVTELRIKGTKEIMGKKV